MNDEDAQESEGVIGRRAGVLALDAEVIAGGQRAALLYAVGANAAHGLRRTNADKRRAVELLLADPEWQQWSDSEIGRRCGVSHPFVGNVRRALETVSSDNTRRIYPTKHGTVATMDTTRIGRQHEDIAVSPKTPTNRLVSKRDAAEQRVVKMRDMAAECATSRQIASAVGLSPKACRRLTREHQIRVRGDEVTGRTRFFKANRILAEIAMAAENATAGCDQIEFRDLDPGRLPEWIASLKTGSKNLRALIKWLEREQQKPVDHGVVSGHVPDSESIPFVVGQPSGAPTANVAA